MEGIRVGVAEVNITPPVGLSLCGFGARKGPSEFIHDDLYARALVLDDGETRIGIVTADIISFAPDLVERIRALALEKAGIPGTHLALNGSHSHSGPTVMQFRSMGDRDPAYEDVLCRQVVGALKMASDRLEAASLRTGRAPARIGHNRREKRKDGRMTLGHNPGGPEAPWVDVLRADRQDGSPMGIFYAHAAHPVNLRGLATSAEYPGYAARFIARNLNGAVPMFAQACCGDINCAPMDGQFETSERQGEILGCATVTAALQAESVGGKRLASACRKVGLPLMVPTVEEAERALEQQREGLSQARKDERVTPYQLRVQYEGQVGWAEDYLRAAREGDRGGTQDFEIQAMRIGDVALVAYPGEMFVEYQLGLDRESPFPRTITLGYTNGCIGYVPMAAAYPEGGYEVSGAFRYYGTLMIAPDCERLIREATLDLLEGLRREA
ncbi:MAG: hypothetical protein EXS64_05350 [Candidatus Latescibacteria bacterium]|nr:hypothetical protein [Candidatus Latescibacterota bacterium]